ncbi:MAG TPA: hypothetical protein VFV38_43705 [Ktedonobacteraceae bacterium]|nr:hypothetical protein [Ktedonobacteraceae bacterium]
MSTQSPRTGRCPLNARSARSQSCFSVDDFIKVPSKPLSRRALLKVGGASAVAASLASVGALAWMPKRAQAMPFSGFPDIQFDIGRFIAPVETVAGIQVQFGPVFTFFAPATLNRNPTTVEQNILESALETIEANYPFSPSGIFTFVSYGIPYFNRLPSDIVTQFIPTLSNDPNRFVLEEAVPSPTDVSSQNPGITKATPNFNVPVTIEANDILFTFRSDSLSNITDVLNWLQGSNELNGNFIASPDFDGLFTFGPTRFNFVQPGLPRSVANRHNLSFASEINPASSMWMGFVDQQTDGSAPNGATVTFAGSSHGVLSSASPGDYFDNGAIQHLSHDIQDLAQFYSKQSPPQDPNGPEPFSERIQYMFRSKQNDGTPGLPFPEDPNDPFTNGGGQGAPTGNLATQQQSAFLLATFLGTDDQNTNFDPTVTDHKKFRVGHLSGLQRSSRASDGTPLHIRNDGPGFSSLDIPDGSTQPTLEFTIFVPTADFFRVMRINAASLDYVKAGQGGGTATSVPQPFFPQGEFEAADAGDDGLERFLTATRRQNFLIPPRRHRSFPLIEFVFP